MDWQTIRIKYKQNINDLHNNLHFKAFPSNYLSSSMNFYSFVWFKWTPGDKEEVERTRGKWKAIGIDSLLNSGLQTIILLISASLMSGPLPSQWMGWAKQKEVDGGERKHQLDIGLTNLCHYFGVRIRDITTRVAITIIFFVEEEVSTAFRCPLLLPVLLLLQG